MTPRPLADAIVLQSFSRIRKTTNPYLVQFLDSLPPDITSVPFSWWRALFGSYDILHIQWPELLVRRSSRARTVIARLLFVLLLARLKVLRQPLVRTAHNLRPHEPGGYTEQLLLNCCDRATTLWVLLNPGTPVPEGAHSVLIPHGHYRDWYAQHRVPERIQRRLLYFGLIRAYKGVPQLLRAFSDLDLPGASLRILGRPDTETLRVQIEDACREDDRAEAVLEHVADADLAREIGYAELVVLPYHELHNSGALLLALSLGRPVLVPRTAAMTALSTEVGPGWVLTYEEPLTSRQLTDALQSVPGRQEGVPLPDLSRREWAALGDRMGDAYRSTLANPTARPWLRIWRRT